MTITAPDRREDAPRTQYPELATRPTPTRQTPDRLLLYATVPAAHAAGTVISVAIF